jgi:hypothetical protein
MDLKALMQKLETINKTEILTEAEKKETTWTDKSGKKHPATQVKGDKYTGKEAEKESKPKKSDLDEMILQSAIAKELLKEFNIVGEEENMDEPEQELGEAGNPWANDPAKSAAWAAMSPEDQKWLGGADPTDPAILARAPNKGKPAATAPGAAPAAAPAMTAADQADADMGAAMRANAAGGNSTSAATGVGNPGEEAAAQAAQAAAPAAPAAVDPAVAATREKFKALLDKLEKTGGVSGSAPAPTAPKPATGAGTKPAAAGFANTGGGAAVGNPNMAKQGVAKESVTYEDDKILLAIKNVRF